MPENDENDLKVAFTVYGKPEFKVISRTQSLKSIIQDLITAHSLDGQADEYCLVLEGDKDYKIVTEKNRHEMHAKFGKPVKLEESPCRTVDRILLNLQEGDQDDTKRKESISYLKNMSVDAIFAKEFFAKKGLSILTTLVSADKFTNTADLVKILQSVIVFMEQEIVSVDELITDTQFIGRISRYINSGDTPKLVMVQSLEILRISVDGTENSENIFYLDSQVALPNLVHLISGDSYHIQVKSLKLINSLLKAVHSGRKTDMVRMLTEKDNRTMIMEHLLTAPASTTDKNDRGDLDYELYMLQYHIFDKQVKERMLTPMNGQDQIQLTKIKYLRSTALETDTSPNSKNNTRFAQDYKKLGFKNSKDPTVDLQVVPPGILALDCMDYLARNHTNHYMNVVLENSYGSDEHECPFAESSIELVKLLADILGIGKDPVASSIARYQEMFFKCEYPFEEFYFHCILILNKTWREMRATREDFTKVFDVVREQIEKALITKNNGGPKTFEEFRTRVRSYTDISKKWQKDANNRDPWIESEPVKVLKQHLSQEIEELIQQQRYNFMVEGTRFQKLKKNGEVMKSQYKYIKLNNNRKTISVGDWTNDKTSPSTEDLEPRIQVQDIKDVLIGNNCTFLKEYNQKVREEIQKTAFCLISEGGDLDCVAPDLQTFHYWLDGINTLLGKQMTSPDYIKEKEILVSIEVKLRLLDLEGVDLPATPPAIPPPPPNLNFSCN